MLGGLGAGRGGRHAHRHSHLEGARRKNKEEHLRQHATPGARPGHCPGAGPQSVAPVRGSRTPPRLPDGPTPSRTGIDAQQPDPVKDSESDGRTHCPAHGLLSHHHRLSSTGSAGPE